ncbi:uncharacterized protein N7484_001513 [Penicillium longicatenatum]|uniref:uncharacterized protein n=1 Tax=Penicillium longicatenatum TaxID=1561947 RepID=UPI00254915CE|nr:uncharacterized protein N7484_001513 [Penicillium longicatenatum]KAJ5657864.1 hypothetical protein N7484_001513 [Penicillium longicatenatum]
MSLNSRIAPIEQLEEVDEDDMHHDCTLSIMVGIEQSGCCVGTKIEIAIVWDLREDPTSFDILV